ncbi:hypothetical protein GQ651_03315 [Alphaproteobacteria bacterium GH1-50]|uniref:Phytase-like domain-containing protein n=1 Tax=Kangsaoukella pontilimi TaxID=2691042 RepID=A0A7C9IEL5_9RHOB|nr:hypothetical protein [Kangsaoukella pontilimi]MXQ06868.1 hypothetical protein [Kangsaoukella pontilimi]
MRRSLAAFALATVLTTPAAALDLKLLDRYSLNRPASLDYDPAFCGLWIANEGPEVILVTLQGEELRRFGSDLSRIKAISIEGNDLIVADGDGMFQRLTKSGQVLGAPFQVSTGWADTEGIAVDADGTLITVEDDPEWLSWLSPDGTMIRRIDTTTFDPPIYEAQGIARDPRTGHLLIVDDMEGSNSLFEFDAEGRLLASQSLIEFGLDPEGIALRPGSDELFIAFDSGAAIASFAYTPTLPEGAEPLPPGADCMMF